MNKTALPQMAMMAAIDLPSGSADVPEWVHLLPSATAGGKVFTADQRGPYIMSAPGDIIAASFAQTDALEVDINHATYIAAPKGERSDAVGWVSEMRTDDQGIWGRVEWTPEGRKLVADKSYRKISPVVMHDAQKRILSIANVSLVNRPNLRGLAALNMETPMTLMEQLIAKLGLAATATEADVVAATAAPHTAPETAAQAAMQAAMTEIGAFVGLPAADAPAIVAAVKSRTTALPVEMAALQAELTTITTEHRALQSQISREKAVAFVDAAIAEVRPSVKPLREHYIARHMQDAAAVEKEIAAMTPHGVAHRAAVMALQSATGGTDLTALNAEQQGRALHDRAVAYQSAQTAKGLHIPLFDAITHVKKDILL